MQEMRMSLYAAYIVLAAGSSRQMLGQLHGSNLGGDKVEMFFSS
jgi:hypothetical protein